MKFAIQINLLNNDILSRIKNVCEQFPHEYISIIPFSNELICNNEIAGTNYIPYGSTSLMYEALNRKWTGLFFNPYTFNYRCAKQNHPDMLNGDEILSVNEAVLYLKNKTGPIFIRPSDDGKQFTGQVIDAAECYVWLSNIVESSDIVRVDRSTDVVISQPKNIDAEWRWFIVNGKIVNGSKYKSKGRLVKIAEYNQDIINYAQKLANKWLPHKNCVMDTAAHDNKFSVVEFNCLNASGFYNHDIHKIFKTVYEHCIENS